MAVEGEHESRDLMSPLLPSHTEKRRQALKLLLLSQHQLKKLYASGCHQIAPDQENFAQYFCHIQSTGDFKRTGFLKNP